VVSHFGKPAAQRAATFEAKDGGALQFYFGAPLTFKVASLQVV